MDLSAFSEDSFDAKDWINNVFKLPEASSNKDAYAGSLIMKLQLFIQEVNNSLEELSQQVLQNLPRVIRDAESVSQEAISLQEQMRAVKTDIVNVEENTAKSMQILVKMDTVKSRILMARKALQEADNWTTLSANVEEVYQSGDVHAIANKLVNMQQSLKILVDVPDYKERAMHLENLKNRLEAMLSPQLITAFNAQSSDAAQIYMTIFSDINRLPALHKYYHKCHKSQLLSQWKVTKDNDPEETLVEWLSNYYDILLSTWHSQVKWCSAVFTDSPIVLLSDLLTDVLNSLDPTLSYCIDTSIKQQENKLQYLMDLKQISERFAKSLEVAIQSYGSGLCKSNSTRALVQAIFAPYTTYVENYPNYEENLLITNLSAVKTDGDDLLDSIHLLGDSVSKVMAIATEASDRCVQFTHGCLFFGLSKAYIAYFSNYITRFHRVVDQLKRSLPENQHKSTLCEDWSVFQNILYLNQICGEFLIQVENLDQTLISSQITAAKKGFYFNLMEERGAEMATPFQTPDKIFLTKADQSSLNLTIMRLQQQNGDPSLLTEVKQIVSKLCDKIVKTTFGLVFKQIQAYLASVPSMQVWKEESSGVALEAELPTYSISPMEYITQIGQYLMTLPQHIEPFILQENAALKAIFKITTFPYASDREPEQSDHVADYLLSCIAQGMMQIYFDTILKITKLTSHSAKQLATDIDYLCNVLDDLGLKPLSNLQTISSLTKASVQEFQASAEGKPTRLVNAIKTMRGMNVTKY